MAMSHTNEWSVPPLECRPLATRMRWCSISQQLRYKFNWELAFLPLRAGPGVFGRGPGRERSQAKFAGGVCNSPEESSVEMTLRINVKLET